MHLRNWLSLRLIAATALGLTLAACTNPIGTEPPDAGGTQTAEPTQASSDQTPTPTEPPYTGSGPWQVTFSSEDDVELGGTLYGDGTTTIVLAPAYPGGQEGWAAFARAAFEQGYRSLTLDFRGHGASKGSEDATSNTKDIAAAINFLKAHGAQKVVLVGAGLGGSASILAANIDGGIAGVGLVSPTRGVEGFQVSDSDLSSLKIPSVWLAARNDLTQNVEEMSALAGSAQKDVWIYEGSSLHGTYIFDGADGSDLQRRLLEFIAVVAG
jgi:pimeloyl-ACP methyl ester carboxylesterase